MHMRVKGTLSGEVGLLAREHGEDFDALATVKL